jgi:hypothetical protein
MDSFWKECAAFSTGVKITQDVREYAASHGLKEKKR